MEEELEEFREKWRQDVAGRSTSTSPSNKNKVIQPSVTERVGSSSKVDELGNELESKLQLSSDSPNQENSYEQQVEAYLKDKNDIQKAVYYFKEASRYERCGRLNEAMKLYRKSCKLEPHVEKHLQDNTDIVLIPRYRGGNLSSSASQENLPLVPREDDLKISYDDFGIHAAVKIEIPEKISDLTNAFAISGFKIEPAQNMVASKTHISALASDALLHILHCLAGESIRSIESFSAVCKYFYILARDNHVWRRVCSLCFHTASPNNIPSKWKRSIEKLRKYDPVDMTSNLIKYHNNYRYMFLYRPHVRFDGVYISIVNYLRQGWAEDSIHHPVHVVTYYRYLRFLANGAVYSLLTSEEPEIVVRKFKLLPRDPENAFKNPPSNINNLMHGFYFLDGLSNLVVAVSDNGITDLECNNDFKSNPPSTHSNRKIPRSGSARSLKSRDASPSPSGNKMTYIMRFKLDATRPMAHNKLVWEEYSGRQVRNGIDETFHYPQNMLRSFIFSRVKSI